MNRASRVSVSMHGNVGILSVAGDLTDPEDPSLALAYNDAVAGGAAKVLLKFHEKSFMNSAGIRLILSVVFRAEADHRPVRATGLSRHMDEIFRLVGLNQHMKIFATEAEAMKLWR